MPNPAAGKLLSMLELAPHEICRWRDTTLVRGDPREPASTELFICVYAQIGGDLRGPHHSSIARLRAHPHFAADFDGFFDSSYLMFFFRVPPAYAAVAEGLAQAEAA